MAEFSHATRRPILKRLSRELSGSNVTSIMVRLGHPVMLEDWPRREVYFMYFQPKHLYFFRFYFSKSRSWEYGTYDNVISDDAAKGLYYRSWGLIDSTRPFSGFMLVHPKGNHIFELGGELMLNDGSSEEGEPRGGSDDAEELQEPRGQETYFLIHIRRMQKVRVLVLLKYLVRKEAVISEFCVVLCKRSKKIMECGKSQKLWNNTITNYTPSISRFMLPHRSISSNMKRKLEMHDTAGLRLVKEGICSSRKHASFFFLMVKEGICSSREHASFSFSAKLCILSLLLSLTVHDLHILQDFMVCTLVRGRMAALARLLMSGNISKPIADDFDRQKLVMQYIHRELHEANEANLIDEQDMHIFDLRPLTDPLCLHGILLIFSELCTSLSSFEEIGLELDVNTGHKKPPRKERRKLPAVQTNQATSVGERFKFENLDASDISAVGSKLETPSAEVKTTLSDGPYILDCSEITATTIPRPKKRSKMVTAECPTYMLDHFTRASGAIPHETVSCSETPRTSETGSEKVSEYIVGEQIPSEATELPRLKKDVPIPLATKIYYSQRTNRLRSALGHLYHNVPNKECSSEFVHERELQANLVTTLTPSPNSFSPNQISDDRLDKESNHPKMAVHKSDQNLAQSSELYSCRSGGYPPAMGISNQFSVNNVLRPHTSLGKLSSNYFSNSYSFADTSGTYFIMLYVVSLYDIDILSLLLDRKLKKKNDGGTGQDVATGFGP
ncbi:hypothetical protein M9H77_36671 [Catharanthus roseus]|uniref:Uncharacterized protein n=1 Tax=Catharanthus roseus TaxID=4058 RepID=A0ACB9ZV22_CATRO|nr:hypothetical protein M9H77_36671 [Catharanthus roseus]